MNALFKQYGNQSEDYLTDVLSAMAVEFIRNTSDHEPFFMVIATPAPHEPFTPSEKYKGRFVFFSPSVFTLNI